MSWSILAAGKAADVKAQFEKQVASMVAHQTTGGKAILTAHAAAVNETCDKFPDSTIVAESVGHLEVAGGNADLKIRKLWE